MQFCVQKWTRRYGDVKKMCSLLLYIRYIYIYTNVWHFVINVYSNFTLTQALSNWLNIHYSSVVSLDVNLLHVFTILSLQVFH